MEKLWTTAEVVHFLGIDEIDVDELVRKKRLTGYQLGGQYLRFRPDQVRPLKGKVRRARRASGTPPPVPWTQKVRDFVYFYDFYIVSVALLGVLVVYLIAAG